MTSPIRPMFSRTKTARTFGRRTGKLKSRPWTEMLEGRQLLTGVFNVTNTNDSGPGSLRYEIQQSNLSPPVSMTYPNTGGTAAAVTSPPFNWISFTSLPAGTVIQPLSSLPAITQPAELSTTPSFSASSISPGLTIDGSKAGAGAVGLTVQSGGVGAEYLNVQNFNGGGVLFDGKAASYDSFTADTFLHNGTFGVEFRNGASGSYLEGDTVSGQAANGVVLTGAGTSGNLVDYDLIGTNTAGSGASGNGGSGVVINQGATGNDVSNDTISANGQWGVYVLDPGTSGNTIGNDRIGTDSTGSYALGNAYHGVAITNGASGNTVGAGDVISGNGLAGVWIGGGANANTVEGDFIGTNAAGTSAIPNAYENVHITGGTNNVIGGTTAAARNVISGSHTYGVWVSDPGTKGNVVEGNFIGTDVTGTKPLGNVDGVVIQSGATGNTIGGTTAGSANLISGNSNAGVVISDAGTSTNLIEGNDVGTDSTVTRGLPNHFGVQLVAGATGNTVGGTAAGAGDVISGNGWDGVQILGAGTSGNVVDGDLIGTSARGSYAIPNGGSGVAVAQGASSNTIGGTTAGSADVISGNGYAGVYVSDAGTNNDVIEGDVIGLSAAGNYAVPNSVYGVVVQNGANGTYVGGWSAAARNVISGNNGIGVLLQGSGTNSTYVLYDFIGTDATGMHAIGNQGTGVVIQNGAQGNFVYQCVVSGNQAHGVSIMGTSTTSNELYMNKIGDDALGNAVLGNAAAGVLLYNTSNNYVFYNSIDDNGDVGLRFWDQALNNYYTPNTYTNNRGGSVDMSLNGVM